MTLERDPEWVPGEPIHGRPTGPVNGQQHVRPIFQLIDDKLHLSRKMAYAWCADCDVTWRDHTAPCWYCGKSRTLLGRRSL